MKIGLECEYFLLDENQQPVLVPPEIPQDGTGWLVEARGNPSTIIEQAVYSMLGDATRIARMLENKYPELEMSLSPIKTISKKLRIEALRRGPKDPISYQNLYGYEMHRNSSTQATAGLHISFTNPRPIYGKVDGNTKETGSYNAMFDWVQIFRKLDKIFGDKIQNTKRRPGFYEIKSDGRVEYRSLPNNLTTHEIISGLYEACA